MSKKIHVGINGFGRIGRTLFRLLAEHEQFEVRAINDLADAYTLCHLLKYDSVHGVFGHPIKATDFSISFKGNEIPILQKSNPSEINWKEHKVDIVIEATGKFKDANSLNEHLKNGAQKVILCVPPNDEDIKMVVFGVNESIITEEDDIISNASCTTNNAAPMLKAIHDKFVVEQAYITTVHSFTSDQNLHDGPHRDLRRARAANQSIIPTTTGAAKALTKIFPDLSEVIGGCGIRVPVPNGSLTDMTLNVKKDTTIHEVNQLFKDLSLNRLNGILLYTEDPIVSIDINNSTHSCTFDSLMTSVIGKMIKIIGWYDNETGYCSRLIDVMQLMVRKNFVR